MTPTRYQTRMTELLGIRHPILCGGFMHLADATYVAAVVNAGAMGSITAKTFPDPGDFRAELRRCAGVEAEGATDYARYRPLIAGALQKEAYETGDWNKGILSVGQSAAFADAVQPVAAIVDQFLAEAAEAETRLAGVAANG